ncbi:metal-dependent transcriptional regulator [Mangrovimonas sp. YM274]|uniref:metal-dependent transcriptional regulator n=1 Tax=Mangrovimonas sp. YM274 TaxID=3070660 RepID=UPI0027DE747B|nr:metal-dependent transcriptional regulator [Mangrovimonas sp. YM274]WMI68835.1 metal-dependent transcriptional regulator [Mangrovimonas sp. YM274]
MLSLSEENYLKAIYHLGKFGAVSVSTSAVAQQMETKASSVTDMIKKLSEKDLVSYRKYQGAKLTNEGRKIAASVVRKHRLWEVFLVEHLNFSWDEVHDVAEQLEHIKSEKLINQLDAFLEFPTHDPHGDPIPDKDGQIKKTEKVLLAQIQESEVCMCIGVKDTSKDFLKYLDKHRIALGTSFKVLSKESFDESMIIEVNDKPLSISKTVSNNLYVKLSE